MMHDLAELLTSIVSRSWHSKTGVFLSEEPWGFQHILADQPIRRFLTVVTFSLGSLYAFWS